MFLIRHGKTKGNLERRYIGRTDEVLCEEGKEELLRRRAPEVQRIYVSPKYRCIQTAEILYPGREFLKVEGFRECDFGRFEGKNYQELSEDSDYQAWIDSGGALAFPEGESPADFRRRCIHGFEDVLDACRKDGVRTAALIVHGGTIMSIMEAYARPRGSYYDFQVGNGEGYELVITDDSAGTGRPCSGSSAGGSEVAVSSGTADRASDRKGRKNYQKLPSEDERR